MKRIWGRILAGEVRGPGSFSVRCLDIVRNLSKAEAELFQHLAPYMIDDKMIVPQNDFVGQINYGAHLMLVDAGLMVRDKVRRFGDDSCGMRRTRGRRCSALAILRCTLSLRTPHRFSTWRSGPSA
jgi:hypothetical protein